MSLLAKLFIGTVMMCTAGVCTAGGALVWWVQSTGWIGVEVESDDGTDFGVHVPAALADLAIRAVPDQVIDEALEGARDEIQPIVPVLQDVRKELDDTPDFTLLEVRDNGENVTIEKRGDHLVVLADGNDGRVSVQVPLSALRSVERLLD